MADRLTKLIGPEEDGRTAGAVLRLSFGLSAARIRSVKFDPAGILLDGERVRVTQTVREGQTLSVLWEDSDRKPDKLAAWPYDLTFLYEDDAVTAVDKPAGLVCHPCAGHPYDTVANALRAHYDRTDPKARVHMAGRLDKETSGVLLFAKNAAAADALQRQRREGRLEKEYLALVRGVPGPAGQEGEIRSPLRAVRDPETGFIVMKTADERTMRAGIRPDTASDGDGSSGSREREAVTRWRTEAAGEGMALLRVRIGTGRTHQIRCHLASAGFPIIGDPLYGDGPDARIGRTALHAEKLVFFHPLTGKRVECLCPMPDDMNHLALSGNICYNNPVC